MQASESQRAVGNLSAAYPGSRKVKMGHDEVGLSKGESMQPIKFSIVFSNMPSTVAIVAQCIRRYILTNIAQQCGNMKSTVNIQPSSVQLFSNVLQIVTCSRLEADISSRQPKRFTVLYNPDIDNCQGGKRT